MDTANTRRSSFKPRGGSNYMAQRLNDRKNRFDFSQRVPDGNWRGGGSQHGNRNSRGRTTNRGSFKGGNFRFNLDRRLKPGSIMHSEEYDAEEEGMNDNIRIPTLTRTIQNTNDEYNWHEVRIQHGASIPKEKLYETIQYYIDGNFLPLEYRKEGIFAKFHVENKQIAEQLEGLKSRLKDPNTGRSMNVQVKTRKAPFVPLSDSDLFLLKKALEKRYDPVSCVLDLSTFKDDPIFKDNPTRVPMSLTRKDVIVAIATALQSKSAQVVALKAQKNRFIYLDQLSNLVYALPDVIGLDLSDNSIGDMRELSKIVGWRLKELNIDQNPLCTNYTSKQKYIRPLRGGSITANATGELCRRSLAFIKKEALQINRSCINLSSILANNSIIKIRNSMMIPLMDESSDNGDGDENWIYSAVIAYKNDVHRYMPDVRKLDDTDIEAPSTFPDLDQNPTVSENIIKIPEFKVGFLVSADYEKLVNEFVGKYITLYDQDNGRSQLGEAYNEDAQFTFICNGLDPRSCRFEDGQKYQMYRNQSHNIIYLDRWERYREKLIFSGRIRIVAKHMELPPTRHDPESLLIDISFANDSLIAFTMHALLCDDETRFANPFESNNELRYVSRQFVGTAGDNGVMRIVNELYYMSSVNSEMAEAYRNKVKRAKLVASQTRDANFANLASSSVVPPDPQTSVASTPSYTNQQVEQMALQLARVTGMLPEWAMQCLQQNEFKYDAALNAFNSLNASGTIPASAFAQNSVKTEI